MNPKQKLGVGTLILGCSRVDHRVGLQLADGAFRVFFCVGAFASLDAVVEFGADHDVDFFCVIDGLDGHDFTYGLFPFSLSVEVGVGLDGADDGVGSDFGDGGALDDVFECGTEFLGANFVEAKGASVTVEDGAVADAESFDDGAGVAPVDEIVFDFFALGVIADGALACVNCRVGAGRIYWCVFFHGIFPFLWLA